MVQMPKDGLKYQQAAKVWRGMENVCKYPNVLEAYATHKIRDSFGLDQLEEVIKGLSDYLELLSILAQTRVRQVFLSVLKVLSTSFSKRASLLRL